MIDSIISVKHVWRKSARVSSIPAWSGLAFKLELAAPVYQYLICRRFDSVSCGKSFGLQVLDVIGDG